MRSPDAARLNKVTVEGGGVEWSIEDSTTKFVIYLRYPRDARRYWGGINSKLSNVRNRYSSTDFVEVSPGDIVADVGGYVGEFALSVAQDAKRIHVFEPDKLSFDAYKGTSDGTILIRMSTVIID